MGRLHRLELVDFKSYAGTQIIGPFENFSAIVGPNGAGKSNMMDAISFVLGVQSRHLRSSHLKELIFRQDADSAPARKASVKLVYIVSDEEVEGMDGNTEIHFSRSISSSGVSSYKLDGKEVTYEAYENLLQRIGVLVKARNFLVFQGDVESVASKSPAELTKLLEQISGSDQLRTEYDDLMKKKDEAEENTILSIQKKKIYLTQRKEVKEQKDEADLYQERQEAIANLKTEHVLWQIWRIKMGMEGHQETVAGLDKDLEVARNREVELEDEMQNGKKELAKLSKALAVAEKEHTSTNKQLDAVTPKLTETRAKLASLKKRIADLAKSEKKLEKDRSEQEESIQGLRADMEALEEAEKELREELEASGTDDVRMDRQKAEEYARLREELAARTASERVEELSIDQELKSKQQRVTRLEAQEETARVELVALNKQIQEYSDRSTMLKGAITSGEKEQVTLRAARDAAVIEMRECEQKTGALTAELDEVNVQLRDAGDDRRRSKQEERMSEAIENMQRIFTGVHGRLVDLCRPIQKKYATPVATTAGKQMDAIVVDSKHVAAECIRYLKDQRVGTCIFLPLDNLIVKPVPERLRALGGRYRLCVDLVEADDVYKPAVSYALGSTLVCESLEDAQELCFTKGEKVKVVTLKGHVITKTGAMTGGTGAREGGDRWEEKEVERMKRRKTEIEEEIASIRHKGPTRQSIVDLETNLKTLQTRMQYSTADLKVSDEKLAQVRQQKTLKENNGREVRKELDALRKEVTKLEKRLAQLLQHTREVERDVFGAFSASVGVANIREYEETKLRHHQELTKKSNAVSEQRASLSAQLEYELKRDFAGALKRFQAQSAEARKSATALEKDELGLLQKEENLIESVRSAVQKVKEAAEVRAKEASKVKAQQSQRSAVAAERASLEKKLAGEEILIERQRAQLHEVLQRAQVDEVALPTVDAVGTGGVGRGHGQASASAVSSSSSSQAADDDEDLHWAGSQTTHGSSQNVRGQTSSSSRNRSHDRLLEEGTGTSEEGSSEADSSQAQAPSRVTDSTHFSQQDNAVVARDRRKAAKVDLSSMQKHRNMTPKQMTEAETLLSKQISSLMVELETMQPNMHAAERYEGVVEKLRECDKELDEAKSAANTVSKKFEDVRKERQQLFGECYQHVSETLGVIYKDLTRSSKHPLGGNAYLTLDNTEEPYQAGIRFTAMPPMKRFRDMDQLSGGEKTMAALALLFSIHSYRQAPFFVLDEVDAALDNVNVKKICNYIRQRSRDFQCVVISLKDMFFEHADILVGICKDVETLSSRVLTLNLRSFDVPGSRPVPALPSSSGSVSGSAVKVGTDRHVLRSPLSSHSRGTGTTPSTTSSASAAGSVASVHSSGGVGQGRGGRGGRGQDESKGGGGINLAGGKRKASDAGGGAVGTGSRRATRTRTTPAALPEAIAEEEGEDDDDEEEGGDDDANEDE